MSQEIIITPKHIEGAITEIRAGKVLLPRDEAARAWNNASDRAIRILRNYQTGNGIFQI